MKGNDWSSIQLISISIFHYCGKKPLKPAFRLLKGSRSVYGQWLYICSPKGFFTQAVPGRWSSVSYFFFNN